MMQLLCIVGLPGSGKTYYANNMFGYESFVLEKWVEIVDDIKSLDDLPTPGTCDILVITDPNFCRTEVRESATMFLTLRYGINPLWRFFENDPVKCRRNVRYRDDGRKVDSAINRLSKEYDIPKGAVVFDIWQPNSENLDD